MIRRVVVAIDGSLNAEQALPVAAGIARRANAQLILLHAIDYRCFDYPDEAPLTDFPCENAEESARRYLEKLADTAARCWKVGAQIVVIEGEALPIILENTGHGNTDLIVMTTHGRGPVRRLWLGSVSDRVVREAGVPVFLIRPREKPLEPRTDAPFRHVLVPLDGSELAEEVLPTAAELAERSGAKLTLLHMLQPALVAALPAFTAALVVSGAYGDDEACDEARQHLSHVSSALAFTVPEIKTAVVPATLSVPNDILQYGHEHGADVIAISTHGLGGFRRAVLGSVADEVIRGASVPVLVYKPSHE